MTEPASPAPRYDPAFGRKTSAEIPADLDVGMLDLEIKSRNASINAIKKEWLEEANRALTSLEKMQEQRRPEVTEHQTELVRCYFQRACLTGPADQGNRSAGLCAPENQTMLYSGRNLDRDDKSTQSMYIADDFAKQNGMTTINMTPGGTWLNRQQFWGPDANLTQEQVTAVWDLASGEFVRQSRGDVVFLEGPEANPHNTTGRIEVPELLAAMQQNPDRKSLIVHYGERSEMETRLKDPSALMSLDDMRAKGVLPVPTAVGDPGGRPPVARGDRDLVFAAKPGVPQASKGVMTTKPKTTIADIVVQARIQNIDWTSKKKAPAVPRNQTPGHGG